MARPAGCSQGPLKCRELGGGWRQLKGPRGAQGQAGPRSPGPRVCLQWHTPHAGALEFQVKGETLQVQLLCARHGSRTGGHSWSSHLGLLL